MSKQENEIEYDEKTGVAVKVLGKPIMVIPLKDWWLFYVEYSSQEEFKKMRKVLSMNDFMILKVTPKRIYFEERL